MTTAPNAPDNCPDPGYVPFGGFIAGGGGPDVAQTQLARARGGAVIFTDAVGQMAGAGGGRTDTGDHTSPQRFTSHPRLQDAINTTSVGFDTSGESLPGRLRPTEWDGEPGWLAAIGGDY